MQVSPIYYYHFFRDRVLLCCPGWSAVTAHCSLEVQCSSNPPASASQVAGTIGEHHHALLIFVCLVQTGFHYVGKAVLELLAS